MRDLIENGEVLMIPVAQITPNPYQPRRFFDTLAIEQLADSIKQYGLLQPITVRCIMANTYELVAGERRLRACKSIGYDCIPALVVTISENEQAILALLENLQRKDLSFFEEAEAYFHLMSDHRLTQEEIAKKVGVTQSTVANKIRLLRLNGEVKDLILKHGLTERHARALLRLSDSESQLTAVRRIIERNMNVQATETYIEQTMNKKQINKRKSIYIANRKAKRDLRVFINTISEALNMVKNAGVPTQTKQVEHDTYYEYIIRIEK